MSGTMSVSRTCERRSTVSPFDGDGVPFDGTVFPVRAEYLRGERVADPHDEPPAGEEGAGWGGPLAGPQRGGPHAAGPRARFSAGFPAVFFQLTATGPVVRPTPCPGSTRSPSPGCGRAPVSAGSRRTR